jgi:hypothetical protein
LDVIAHALWTTAAGTVARSRLKRRIHLGWLATFGVLPDLAVFAIPAAVRIGRLLTGASKSLLPDGSGPRFDWIWGLYNFTHSAVIFAVCFGAVWLWARRPVLEMLGWALHIFIDIFTHEGLFAIRFLWPLSSVRLQGIRWETHWLLAANYAALASLYLMLWLRRARHDLRDHSVPHASSHL